MRTLPLHGDLDVFSIHQQWEHAQTLLTTANGPVELDLSDLGDLDLSGIQLLYALERDLQAKGVQLSVTGAPEDWLTRFAPLGLAGVLGGKHP